MASLIPQPQAVHLANLKSSTIPVVNVQTTYCDFLLLTLTAIAIATYYSNGKVWNKSDPFLYKLYERPQQLHSTLSPDTDIAVKTRNIAAQLEQSGRDCVIFWASQSGRAEAFAGRLGKELQQRLGILCLVADVSEYDPETIADISKDKLVVFVMSTYGEGDPPDNGWLFWEWIKLAKNDTSFNGMQYAAFGLGNSNYRYYNKVIDVVAETLEMRGATALLPTGKADDARNGTEEDFLHWKECLLQELKSRLGLVERKVFYQPAISIDFRPQLDIQALHKANIPKIQHPTEPANAVVQVPLSSAKIITSTQPDKQCLHLEVDLSNHPHVKYKTGDHLMLWPENPKEEVNRLLTTLNLIDQKSTPIKITSLGTSGSFHHLAGSTTLFALFTYHLEICAPVSREVIQALCEFAPSDRVRIALSLLAADKGSYAEFMASKYITFGRLLEYALELDRSAVWTTLPLSFVLESLKPMSPRYYSISSSSSVSPRRATITVTSTSIALANKPTVLISGLASRYLSSCVQSFPSDTNLIVQVHRSDFKLPANSSTPLILVAAGSGIAPIRAFLHERARLARLGRETGRILLFYGCRYPEQDFLYRREIEELQVGCLKDYLKVVTAFSRQRNDKVYVQDRVEQYSDEITNLLIDESASLYICGSTVMAKAVGDRIVEAAERHVSLRHKNAQEWRLEMKRFRRWQEDVWG